MEYCSTLKINYNCKQPLPKIFTYTVDLEQYGSELCGSTYIQTFCNKYIGKFVDICDNLKKTFFSSLLYCENTKYMFINCLCYC